MGPHSSPHLAQRHFATLEPIFEGEPADRDASAAISLANFNAQALKDRASFLAGRDKPAHWLRRYMLRNRHAVPQYRRELSEHVGPEVCKKWETMVYDEIIREMAGCIGKWSFLLADPNAEFLIQGLGDLESGMDEAKGELWEGMSILLPLLEIPSMISRFEAATDDLLNPSVEAAFVKILDLFYESSKSGLISKPQRNYVCVRTILCFYKVLCTVHNPRQAHGKIEELFGKSMCGSNKEIERQVRLVLKSFNKSLLRPSLISLFLFLASYLLFMSWIMIESS